MAVAFQAASAGARATGTGNVSTTHTCSTSDAQTVVIVGVVCSINSSGTYTPTVTYGGVAMTLLNSSENLASNGVSVQLFYLFNPPTGAQTVQVTNAGTATRASTMVGSASYTGVVAVDIPRSPRLSGATGSQSFLTNAAAGDMGVVVGGSSSTFSTFGGTQRYAGGGSVSGYGDYMRFTDVAGTATAYDSAYGDLTINSSGTYHAAGALLVGAGAAWTSYSDDFSGSLAQWSAVSSNAATSAGALSFPYNSQYVATARSDFTDQAVFAKYLTGTLTLGIGLGANREKQVAIKRTSSTDIRCLVDTTTVYTSTSNTDPWMRIAESSGTVTFSTSADGITWTTIATASTPGILNNAWAYLAGGPATADNWCLAPFTAWTADAALSATAGLTGAIQRGTTVAAATTITATLPTAARQDTTGQAAVSVTANRDGSTTLTTPSGTAITTTAALTSQVTITRPASGSRPVTAGFAADGTIGFAAEAALAIGATLSADAAKGLLTRQLDVTAMLSAAASVFGQTGGNTWATALLTAVAAVYANLDAEPLDILADREVAALNLAPADGPDTTTAILTADTRIDRGVALDLAFGATLTATAAVTAVAAATLTVGVARTAAVRAAYKVRAELQAALAPTDASAWATFHPQTPPERTMRIPAESRTVRVGAEDRSLRVDREGRTRNA